MMQPPQVPPQDQLPPNFTQIDYIRHFLQPDLMIKVAVAIGSLMLTAAIKNPIILVLPFVACFFAGWALLQRFFALHRAIHPKR